MTQQWPPQQPNQPQWQSSAQYPPQQYPPAQPQQWSAAPIQNPQWPNRWPTGNTWSANRPQAYSPPTYPPQQAYPQQYQPQQYQPTANVFPAQQPYGQQQIPQYPYPYQYLPPKKSHTGRNLLIAIIGVVIAGAFFISLINFLSEPSPRPTPGPFPQPTASKPGPVPSPTKTAAVPEVKIPAPDSDPPELPAPETYSEATELLEDNPLYGQSVLTTDCAVGQIDLVNATKKELQAHLNELTGCLWRVWNPPLTKANFKLPRPPVTVFTTSSVTSACGKISDTNAVYCGADQRIYYARNVYLVIPKKLRTSAFIAESVIAHEFGHAIQGRTGILLAESAWEQKSSSKKSEEFSRRTEMQADCFAGIFATAVSQANDLTNDELSLLPSMFENLGDDVLSGDSSYIGEHGSGKARSAWFNAGQNTDQIATCNTYVAKSSQVR